MGTPIDTHRLCQDRLNLSEQIIVAWEVMQSPSGDAGINLRLIESEIQILQQLAVDRPTDAVRAHALTVRYREMADLIRGTVRDGANPLARVTKSRQTLHLYRTLPGGTHDRPEWLLRQIREELAILQSIEAAGGQGAGIESLMSQWREFADSRKVRAN